MRLLFLSLVFGVSTSLVFADGAADKQTLVNAAIEHEHAIVKATSSGQPLLETYLQFYNSVNAPPVSDKYTLSELASARILSENRYVTQQRVSLSRLVFGAAKTVVRSIPNRILYKNFADMVSPMAEEIIRFRRVASIRHLHARRCPRSDC